MATQNLGGTVNSTSAFCGPWGASGNNFFYSGDYAMPTTRVALGGNTPIYVADVGIAYSSGPLTDATIVYQGVETSGGYLFANSGGGAQLRAYFSSGGTLYVGRATGNGFTLYCYRSGGSWSGGLVGSVSYGQVATAPQSLSVTTGAGPGQINVNFAAPANNGDLAISNYTIQYATSTGGPWTTYGTTTSGTNVITLAPGSYAVRVYANNAAGSSVAATSASTVPTGGGGQRYSGSAWTPLVTGKRYTGLAWTDLTIRKRYTGSAWVDISN